MAEPIELRARPTPRLARAVAMAVPVLLLAPVAPGVLLVVAAWNLLLLALWLAEARRLRRLVRIEVAREAPARLGVGTWNEVGLRVASRAPLELSLRLDDGCPREFDLEPVPGPVRVAPYREARATYRLRPRERGRYHFGDLRVEAEARPGLAALVGRVPLAGEARVYPDLAALRRTVLGANARDLASEGLRQLRREGSGDEFDKLRDYVPDDDYRDINWKATAKRSRPVTQVYVAERSQRVLIAIDCGRTMAARAGDLTRLDLAVNAALVLADVALRSGDRVGLTTFSSEVHSLIPPGRGRAHFARLVEALQGVREELVYVDYKTLVREIVSRRIPRGLVVMFTDLIDEASSRPLVEAARLLARKHATLVVVPADPVVLAAAEADASSVEDVYRGLAAREALGERRAVLQGVRALGVQVVDARAADLAVAGVNRYLEMKRRRAI